MALTKITANIIEDGAITSAKLASGAVSASSLTSITTDNVSEGSTNLYYTDARADARIAAATTDDLTEGSTNLYFTNERVDDRVNALLTAGTGITLTYDDANNTLTVAGAAQYGDSDVESYLSGGTGVTFSSGVISIGQDVGTSATPTFGNTIVGTLQATSFSDGTISGITFIDEDSFATNSATRVPTQQSIKAYVDTQVAGVVDSAPAALDTLNELAAALGDDANFSTTTSTALGNRLRVDTAAQGLTGTQQANAITNLGITATKAELNFVDGVTSNIQTQLDGKQATGSYLTGNQTITLSGDVSGSGTTSIAVTIADDSHNHVISNVDGLQTALDAKLASSSYTASDVLTKIKTVDGAGSGLDADLLDGLHGSSYLTLSGGTMTGGINMSNTNISGVNAFSFNDPGPNEGLSWSGGNIKIYESPDNLTTNSAGNLQIVYGSTRRLTVNNLGIDVNGSSNAQTFKLLANTSVSGSDATIFRPADNTMAFSTNGGERMRIDSAGNVGIGVTPVTKFHVRVATNANFLVQSALSSTALKILDNAASTYTAGTINAGSLSINADSGGQTLINTTDGNMPTAGGNADFIVYGGAGNGFAYNAMHVGGGRISLNAQPNSNSTRGYIQCDGAGFKLFHVDNSDFIIGVNNLEKFRINWSSGRIKNIATYNNAAPATHRDVYVENNGDFGYASSVRAHKTNITTYGDASWLYNLDPVTFNYRKPNTTIVTNNDGYETEVRDGTYSDTEYFDTVNVGFIAEDVEEHDSNLCFYNEVEDEEGNVTNELAGIHYKSMVVPMLKLIQEQKGLIDNLTARIETLENP